jgi:hypothetical protein
MSLRTMVFCAALATLMAGPAGPARAADPVFPAGSHIGFVPPPGFVASKRFPGFENAAAGSSMILITLPPEAFAEAQTTLTADALKQHGVAEVSRETLMLPNGRALLVIGTETESGQKFRRWMFLALLPEATALATVSVPEPQLAAYSNEVIKASLMTIAARDLVPIEELLSLVPFRLDELAGLRPIRVLGSGGVVLTAGPTDAANLAEQPMFVVSIAAGGPEQAEARANYARNLFTGLGDFKDLRIVSTDMLRLGGGVSPTHELQAEANDVKTNKPVKLVQWVRFGSGVVIRMVGVARADQWTGAFTQFRAVRDGVALRE